MNVSEFTIFGERCSGTNWLQKVIETSTDLPVTWRFGWKHFPGFSDLSDSDNCLFLCIFRNPYDWLTSLFLNPYHVAMHLRGDFSVFLGEEFYSWHDEEGHIRERLYGTEVMQDRHIREGRRYRNILELRNVKNSYLLESLPANVRHHHAVNYDYMQGNPDAVLHKISERFDLPMRIRKDVNSFHAKRGGAYEKRHYVIQPQHVEIINNGLDWRFEEMLGFKKRGIKSIKAS